MTLNDIQNRPYTAHCVCQMCWPDTFSVAWYLPSGGMRVFQYPRWSSTWRAAELWGWVHGVRLAGFMKWPRVCVGGDNIVGRCQIQGHRGAVFFCSGQQRILRSLFWLRRWSGMPIAGFFVPSERNLADPPSTVHEFDSERSCLGFARQRYCQWRSSPFLYQDFLALAHFPCGIAPRDSLDRPSSRLAVDGA